MGLIKAAFGAIGSELHDQWKDLISCENMENDYSVKLKEETKKIEDKYENKIYHLESENNYLRKIISTLKQTLKKVFIWISNKLSVSEEDELIRKFEAFTI